MDDLLNKTEDFQKEFGVGEFILLLWKRKTLIILVNSFFFIGSILYSLLTDEIYEVSTTIRPAQPSDEVTLLESSFFSQLTLVSGKMELPVSKEIQSYLFSSTFLIKYYDKYKDSTDNIFSDRLQKIKNSSLKEPVKSEKMQETALKILKNDVIKLNDDGFLMTIAVRLEDKYRAKDFLIEITHDLRNYIQQKNKHILHDQISYYEEIKNSTSDPGISATLQSLINKKIEKSYLISTDIFQIIEEPYIPVRRYWPKRSLVVAASTLFGFVFSFFFAVAYSFSINVYNQIKRKIQNLQN